MIPSHHRRDDMPMDCLALWDQIKLEVPDESDSDLEELKDTKLDECEFDNFIAGGLRLMYHYSCHGNPCRNVKLLADQVVLKNCDLTCPKDCKAHTYNTHMDDVNETETLYPISLFSGNCVCGYPSCGYVDDIQPYTPDNDHCYYATTTKIQISSQPSSDIEDKMDILKNIPTPPSTSESPSETSSDDEVDVVTVLEEYQPPVVPRYVAPRRSTRSSRSVKKPQRTQVLSAKSLKAAMKRTRMQSVSVARRPYTRRKVQNSVETTPSSSVPSSAQSSRCNSDAEDIDKRQTHNSSERKRREAQRTALQNLRVCIPDLQSNPKAPKVLILNSATTLIKKVEHSNETLAKLKSKEKQRKRDLKAKLHQLRMQIKMSHARLQ